jgi:formate-dependent nitrite reductase membrane component NrfD
VFLGITGALLIADLEHPERFYMIFTRPQWKSWLVRGAFIIGAYSAVLAVHFFAGAPDWLMVPGIPLAVLTAVYTAYLFAQSKARDLWQSPLLPASFVVHTLLAGSAALSLVGGEATQTLAWITAGSALVHLLLVLGEATLAHVTAHARLASWEMTSGRFRNYFWSGVVLVGVGVFAPVLGPWASLAALFGLLAHEHAHVQAAQAVPLA